MKITEICLRQGSRTFSHIFIYQNTRRSKTDHIANLRIILKSFLQRI